jgi:hypothetical protein
MKLSPIFLVLTLFCLSITAVATVSAFTANGNVAMPLSSDSDQMQLFNYELGDTLVNVTVESRPGARSNIQFINVHENENTSTVACRVMQYYHGGKLTRIRHGGQRLVTFTSNLVDYTFDPNRMFTKTGAAASLKQYGRVNDAVVDLVIQFGQQLLKWYDFDAQPIVLALHNNSPRYSARQYLPGGEFYGEAAAVHIKNGSDARNFCFVTDKDTYTKLTSSPYELNAVLQKDAQHATDDGSLSYYAAINNKPYVNIEAAAASGADGDQVLAQLNMIELASQALFPAND